MSRELPDTIKVRQRDKSYKETSLLVQFPVNGHFQIGVYQGLLPSSKYDILIKYKQFINNRWTSPRTPKHIHWAVDILLKQNANPEGTERFLDFLIGYWNQVEPFTSEEDRLSRLNQNSLMNQVRLEAAGYSELAEHGEYSIKFLILLAKLLMIQEKTNYPGAYMFKDILEGIKKQSDLFSILSKATHR